MASSSAGSRLRGSPPAPAPPRTTVQPPTSSPARNHRSSPPLLRRAKAAAVGSSGLVSSSAAHQSPRSLRSRETGSLPGRNGSGSSSSPGRSIDPSFFSYALSPASAISSNQTNIGRQQQQPLAQAGPSGSNCSGAGGVEAGTAGCGFEVYSDRPSAAILTALRRRAVQSPAANGAAREPRQTRRLSAGSTSTARTGDSVAGDGSVAEAGDDEEDIAKENIPVARLSGSPSVGASSSALLPASALSTGASGAAALKRRRSASSSLSLCSASTTATTVTNSRKPAAPRTVETRASKTKAAPTSAPTSSETAVEDALACRSTATSSPSALSTGAGGQEADVNDDESVAESTEASVGADSARQEAASPSPAKRPTTTATIASLEMPPPALLRFSASSNGAGTQAARLVSSPRQGERSSPRHRRPTAVEGVFT